MSVIIASTTHNNHLMMNCRISAQTTTDTRTAMQNAD